jgi:ketosteroid isomerase-like protein
MSQENVEIVRTLFEVWNAGDMDAFRELLDPDVMIVGGLEGWPETGPVVGRDAVMGYFEQLRGTFDSDWQELISDPIGMGDRVAVRTVWHGVGHGPELKQESTVVSTVRKRRVLYVEFFWDHAEALKTIGLSERPNAQIHVEIVRRAWQTANSDDFDPDVDLDGWLDQFFDPEIEWHDLPMLPEEGVHRGREAVRQHFVDYQEAWADSYYEVEDARAAGDRVLVRGRYGGVGKQSGAEVSGALSQSATWAVYDFREGHILRVRQFVTHAEALEAASTSQQDAHAES